MHKPLLLTSLLLVSVLFSFAQCDEGDDPTVLLMGDSWAFFMNADGTFNNVMEHWGHSDQNFFTNPDLSVSGARTEDLLTTSRLTELQNQIEAHPTIDVVHISLGGNDFLGGWNVDFTDAETEELSDQTYAEMTELVDFIKGVRADIHIVFSGYMYANFGEVIGDAEPFEESHIFYGNWEEMGFPNFEQLNTLLNGFSDRLYAWSESDPQIDFVHVPGLMQRLYGQETPLGIDPGGTYPPFFQPLPFGDITYPSPKECMRDYGLFRDCFHLSVDGFFRMIDFQFQKFYHKFLMDDAFVVADLSDENGAVTSDGTTSGVISLGENGGIETKTILSFNTAGFADTIIAEASIFLRRDSLLGGNPIGSQVTLVMVNGNLGSSADVDASDFSDVGDIMGTACVFGTSHIDSGWVRIDLPEAFLPFITNDGTVQFSIASEDASGDQIFFTNGADPETAPVFNVKYKFEFAGLEDNEMAKNDLILYPNPAKEQINLFSPSMVFDQVEVINAQGQIVLSFDQNSKQIPLDKLKAGNYFIRITAESEVIVRSFIKE